MLKNLIDISMQPSALLSWQYLLLTVHDFAAILLMCWF